MEIIQEKMACPKDANFYKNRPKKSFLDRFAKCWPIVEIAYSAN